MNMWKVYSGSPHFIVLPVATTFTRDRFIYLWARWTTWKCPEIIMQIISTVGGWLLCTLYMNIVANNSEPAANDTTNEITSELQFICPWQQRAGVTFGISDGATEQFTIISFRYLFCVTIPFPAIFPLFIVPLSFALLYPFDNNKKFERWSFNWLASNERNATPPKKWNAKFFNSIQLLEELFSHHN